MNKKEMTKKISKPKKSGKGGYRPNSGPKKGEKYTVPMKRLSIDVPISEYDHLIAVCKKAKKKYLAK